MKKILISLLLAGLAGLVGCGATDVTTNQIALHDSTTRAQSNCYAMVEVVETERMRALSKIPRDQLALVMMVDETQKNNELMISMFTGKSANPCDVGTNINDVKLAEVTEKNKTIRSGISLGKWVVGGYTIDRVTGNIFDAVGNQIMGDGNSLSSDAFKFTGDENETAMTPSQSTTKEMESTDDSYNSEEHTESHTESEESTDNSEHTENNDTL